MGFHISQFSPLLMSVPCVRTVKQYYIKVTLQGDGIHSIYVCIWLAINSFLIMHLRCPLYALINMASVFSRWYVWTCMILADLTRCTSDDNISWSYVIHFLLKAVYTEKSTILIFVQFRCSLWTPFRSLQAVHPLWMLVSG